MYKFCFQISLMTGILVIAASSSFGQNQQPFVQRVPPPIQDVQSHWTQQLAAEGRSHDFGVVPGFSDQQHVFEIENIHSYPIELVAVRASCGCTRPYLESRRIEPGACGHVKAVFDTRNFKGPKKATVTVTVKRDQPYTNFGEVQFNVAGTIRKDVVLSPGVISFENISKGEGGKKSVDVLYAGNPNWKIREVKSSNSNITVNFEEKVRNPQTQRVDYVLTAELGPDQAVGTFADQLIVVTNDVNNKHLTIPVQGNVKSMVQVSPVKLGTIEKDRRIRRKVILRGDRPFGIRSVSTGNSRIKFQQPSGNKTLHVLYFDLDTSMEGLIKSQITFETDDPDQRIASTPFEANIVLPSTFAVDEPAGKE